MVTPASSAAEGHLRISFSETENFGVYGSLKTAIDRKVDAINPARAVRAKKQDRRRDIGGRSRSADPSDVLVDASVAKDLTKFL